MMPTFAKLAPEVIHAPGLFESRPKGKPAQLRTLTYQVGERLLRFVGPQLGVTELRVLQGLTALAGPQSHPVLGRKSGGEMRQVTDLMGQRIAISTTYEELACSIGYQADSGSANAAIRRALENLFMLAVFVGTAAAPRSKDFAAGHLFTQIGSREAGGRLVVEMCPVLAVAVLGGPGQYLRVSLDEARRLKSDVAHLLHHRLHWINQGQKRDVGLSTMLSYVWPDMAVSESTLRTRRQTLRKALDELVGLGWTVSNVGNLYSIGRPRTAISQTGELPYRRRSTAVSQTLADCI